MVAIAPDGGSGYMARLGIQQFPSRGVFLWIGYMSKRLMYKYGNSVFAILKVAASKMHEEDNLVTWRVPALDAPI